jgi:uncharacterized protein YcbK (DUF882 family)
MTMMSLHAKVAAMVFSCASTATLAAQPAQTETSVAHGAGLATKKDTLPRRPDDLSLLATLDQIHTGERLVLDAASPSPARFSALVADRSTGDRRDLDERLLGLLRELAAKHPGGRIELVSGYRSPKLNEMLRKKGHHVASHSQHSLGHACDFRLIPPGHEKGIDPRTLEVEIRKLGWDGGVGVYPTDGDWFVHADVGRNRRWEN